MAQPRSRNNKRARVDEEATKEEDQDVRLCADDEATKEEDQDVRL